MASKNVLELYNSGTITSDFRPPISYTGLNCALDCERQYFYYSIGTKIAFPIPVAFGDAVHYKFEEFWHKKYNLKKNENGNYVSSFAMTFPKYWDLVKRGETKTGSVFVKNEEKRDEEFKKYTGYGIYVLTNFHKINESLKKERKIKLKDILEKKGLDIKKLKNEEITKKSREFQLDSELGLFPKLEVPFKNIEFNGFYLRGEIDRIDNFGEGFVVIDYKSGYEPLPEKGKSETRDHQFTFYSLAVKHLFGKDPIAFFYWRLRADNLRDALDPRELDQSNFDYLKESLDNYKPLITTVNWSKDVLSDAKKLNKKRTIQEKKTEERVEKYIKKKTNDGIQTLLFGEQLEETIRENEIKKQKELEKTNEYHVNLAKHFLSPENFEKNLDKARCNHCFYNGICLTEDEKSFTNTTKEKLISYWENPPFADEKTIEDINLD